jgi:hypothetical protein
VRREVCREGVVLETDNELGNYEQVTCFLDRRSLG